MRTPIAGTVLHLYARPGDLLGDEGLLDMADLDEGYLASREAQAQSKLCADESASAVLTSGATYVFNWFSADDESIGMVTLRGTPESCA